MGNKGRKKKREKKGKKSKKVEDELIKTAKELEDLRGTKILTLFFGDQSINSATVNSIYDKLHNEYEGTKKLDVIIDSGGGDIDAAYMLAKLLRRYASEKLTFIIPRWAKSAATLLVCGGDEIIMGPISEMGPLDPQIVNLSDPAQSCVPHSPLAIRSTLDLIEEEIERGKKELAEILSKKLLPLTLGTYLKSLEIGEKYQEQLLLTRMFLKDKNKKEKASKVAQKLSREYPHHGYCIDVEEAKKELKLKVKEPSSEEWDLIWKLYKKYDENRRKKRAEKMKKMEEDLKKILKEKARDGL